MRKTKIVCTLGPSTSDEGTIRRLMLSGMNVARLNFSHGNGADQKPYVDLVKKLREELDLPVALLLDTKGPEIRVKEFGSKSVALKTGSRFTLTTRDVVGDENAVSVTFDRLPKEVHPGATILIDDGLIGLKVDSCTDTDILCTGRPPLAPVHQREGQGGPRLRRRGGLRFHRGVVHPLRPGHHRHALRAAPARLP